jgi:hypothetical protein
MKVRFSTEADTFRFPAASSPPLAPTPPPLIQLVLEALSERVPRPGNDADRSAPTSAKIKNAWRYTSTPPIYLQGVVLK